MWETLKCKYKNMKLIVHKLKGETSQRCSVQIIFEASVNAVRLCTRVFSIKASCFIRGCSWILATIHTLHCSFHLVWVIFSSEHASSKHNSSAIGPSHVWFFFFFFRILVMNIIRFNSYLANFMIAEVLIGHWHRVSSVSVNNCWFSNFHSCCECPCERHNITININT